MSLELGLNLGVSRGGIDGLALGRVLNLDWATGRDYSALSITSSSAYSAGTGPLVITDTGVTGKPAEYLGGLRGARVDGTAPAWTAAGGAALSGVTWMGPLPARTTKNIWSKPTPGTNNWTLSGATDGGDVPGPDGSATSARRITFSATSQQIYRAAAGTASAGDRLVAIIKGTNGNKINMYYGLSSNTVSMQISLNGEWQYIDVVGAVSGTPTGQALSINTINAIEAGGLGVTASQAVDVFMLQASAAPFCFVQTAGANITALAETITGTVAALGASFSIMGTLNLSGGLPSSTLDIITSGADKIQVNSTGKLIITDGTLTTTSTASLSAATGQKFGFSRTAAGSTLQIGATQEAGEAVNWTGDTVLTVGVNAPLQRWSVWQRAISAAEMTAYV